MLEWERHAPESKFAPIRFLPAWIFFRAYQIRLRVLYRERTKQLN
jgi:hypothetical protein